MNEGLDFPRPPDDDEASDPLLAALRQRLGPPEFGQEPAPDLWAGIQARLPVAPAARPWWLRARRLLPLLATLVGVLLASVVATRRASRRAAEAQLAAARPPAVAGSRNAELSDAGRPALAAAPKAAVAGATAAPPAATVAAAATGGTRAIAPQTSFSSEQPGATRHQEGTRDTQGKPAVAVSVPGGKADRPAARLAREERSRYLTAALIHSGLPGSHSRPTTRARNAESGYAPAASPSQRSVAAMVGQVAARRRRPTASIRRATRARAVGALASGPLAIKAATRSRRARFPGRRLQTPAGGEAGSDALSATAAVAGEPRRELDALALRRVVVPQPELALPVALAARPDSTTPWALPVRRWAVLVLAGPTLSYRALRPTALAQAASPTNTPVSAGYQLNPANLTDLERPAVGLGAQAQVRRVLTGRWALALGLGYQEYATRLNLRVTSPVANGLGNGATSDSTLDVRQRDTYQLLTLPVQLSYALGPPHGRWALALLLGAEPGWYQGGRTTENSTCSCQQQTFTSASGSPYSAVSLALSLGLDVRYRLGGPAARWQLLVQPTGRYVVSPFVRNAALGYSQRQPYSLGLLTGVAWDFR